MTNPAAPARTAQPEPQGSTMYRTRADVCRILQFLASDRCPVSVEVGAGKRFVSFLISVDADAGHFVVAYSADKPANSLLFGRPLLEFAAEHGGAHLMFRVSAPVDTLFDGQAALQFALPPSVTLHRRRKQPRVSIPEDISLRCIADEGGVISFEARITDISLDGMGGLFYNADIFLESGTVLKGSRITLPGGRALTADLEVRYVKAITLADGTLINRAGVRFMQRPAEIEELVGMFIRDADNRATPG